MYNSAAGDLLPGVPHDDGLSELRVRGEADLPRGQELGLHAVHARARHAQDGASREAGAGLRRAKKKSPCSAHFVSAGWNPNRYSEGDGPT